MTFAELQTLLGIYLRDPMHDRFPVADKKVLINRAQEVVQTIIDDADEAYFSGVAAYDVDPNVDAFEFDLPSDCRTVVLAERLVSGGKPIPASWVPFSLRHKNVEQASVTMAVPVSGSPVCYLRGNKIGVVAPAEDYTLRVFYTKRLPTLVNDGDTSEIPADYHQLIALHATKIAMASESRQFEETWGTEFTEQMNRLQAFIEQRQRQAPRYVHYTPE